jgi:hypothetical protein
MREVDQFSTPAGDKITLGTDGTQWEVACWAPDGRNIWTEKGVVATSPFTEEQARAEFERWCVGP